MAGGIPTSFQIGAKVTPQAAAANYTSGASGKGAKWATNYLQSKVNPFTAASDAAPTCVANFNAAGAAAIQAGLARVNQAAVAKLVSTQGPTLYTQGITNKGTPKYAIAAQGLIPALQNAAANLPPRGSLQQNIARSAAMITAAKAMKGLYKG
jgi:hypothetical protein